MKVKTCVNSPYTKYNGWGKVGSDFPRIYVWIVTRFKELNVTKETKKGKKDGKKGRKMAKNLIFVNNIMC